MKNIFNGKIKYLLSSLLFIFIFFISISNIQTGFACSTGYEPDCGDTYNSSCPAGTVPSADGWSCVSSASSSCPAGTVPSADGWSCVSSASSSCPAGT
ncbi:MAG: hypothetical protein KBD12_00375, partial [Candidatus Pacebacteria bacterium]|nr:hypothetical protein [Candidatus Paceibacterota bacterium]